MIFIKVNGIDQQIKRLNQVAETMMRKFHTYIFQFSELDLTPAQQYLLTVLKDKVTCTPTEIAQHMGVTSGAVTSLTDRLYKHGFIVRDRSQEDRRLVIIKLTPEGEKKAEQVEEERMTKMRKLFSNLKPESINSLCEIYYEMDKILNSLLQE